MKLDGHSTLFTVSSRSRTLTSGRERDLTSARAKDASGQGTLSLITSDVPGSARVDSSVRKVPLLPASGVPVRDDIVKFGFLEKLEVDR